MKKDEQTVDICPDFKFAHSNTRTGRDKAVTIDQPDEETSTSQTTTLARDTHIYAPDRFEPATPEMERPQTYALDRAATGIGLRTLMPAK